MQMNRHIEDYLIENILEYLDTNTLIELYKNKSLFESFVNKYFIEKRLYEKKIYMGCMLICEFERESITIKTEIPIYFKLNKYKDDKYIFSHCKKYINKSIQKYIRITINDKVYFYNSITGKKIKINEYDEESINYDDSDTDDEDNYPDTTTLIDINFYNLQDKDTLYSFGQNSTLYRSEFFFEDFSFRQHEKFMKTIQTKERYILYTSKDKFIYKQNKRIQFIFSYDFFDSGIVTTKIEEKNNIKKIRYSGNICNYIDYVISNVVFPCHTLHLLDLL